MKTDKKIKKSSERKKIAEKVPAIINKIEQNVQKKSGEISKIFTNKSKLGIHFIKKGDNKEMGISQDDKIVLIGDYHFFGIYQPWTKLWIWASSIPGIDINHIKFINKIKSSSNLFESDNDERMMFYYQMLTQDTILIPNEKMLGWINDLLLYLSDDLYCFNPKNSEGNIQFLSLIKIKEKYI